MRLESFAAAAATKGLCPLPARMRAVFAQSGGTDAAAQSKHINPLPPFGKGWTENTQQFFVYRLITTNIHILITVKFSTFKYSIRYRIYQFSSVPYKSIGTLSIACKSIENVIAIYFPALIFFTVFNSIDKSS